MRWTRHNSTPKTIRKIGIAVFWLALWQIAAVLIHNTILFAGPLESARALALAARDADFWKTAGYSAARIAAGFLSAFTLGVLVGGLTYRRPLLGELLEPLVSVMRSVPVAVFTVIFLIWFGATGLTVLVSFFIVFPHVYAGCVAGLKSTDVRLLEMAEIMRTEWWKKLFFIYRPALQPFLYSCAKSTLGMSWKSGVAAEVIGTPAFSMGERLYMSKIYLDTAGVFAWTFVIILCSLLFEKVFLYLLRLEASRSAPALHGRQAERPDGERAACLRFTDVSLSYGGEEVISRLSLSLEAGGIYCLMGVSGQGKTTLLKLAAGLLQPEAGLVEGCACSMAFQEDRLCPRADAVWNVRMAGGVDERTAREHLRQLLRPEETDKPVDEMSGGMKRRVALCRAVAAKSRLLLLDEPFNGLDEDNRRRAAAYLIKEQDGRIILLATHREEDAALLGAQIIRLD